MSSAQMARIGAAAVAVGLSVVGPAVGVASADAGADPSAVSAGPAAAGDSQTAPTAAARRGAGRPSGAVQSRRRNARPNTAAAQRSTAANPVVRASEATGSGGLVPRLGSELPEAVVRQEPAQFNGPQPPVAAAAVDTPSRVPDTRLTRRVSQATGIVSIRTASAIDALGKQLSKLPGGPLAELFAGGLWLVRRTLDPVGADVGRWGSAACVATKDCAGKDLAGADLRGADLSRVDFSNANLLRANLQSANLSEATLSYAHATALFTNANLALARADHIDLTDAVMRGVTITNSDLYHADLDGALLAGAKITLTDLELSFLGNADLTGAKLDRVNLRGAYLTGANLRGVQWTDVTCPDGSNTNTGCSAGPVPGDAKVLGQFVINWTEPPRYLLPEPAPIGVCFGGSNSVQGNRDQGCQPPSDPTPANPPAVTGVEYTRTVQRTAPNGDKYYDFGGGNWTPAAWWNEAVLDELNSYMPTLQNYYQGVFYDIETFEGDPQSFDVDGISAAFSQSFEKAKSYGLKVIVSTSYTAPYQPYDDNKVPEGPGIALTDEVWRRILADPNVDYFAPQFYAQDGTTADIEKTSGSTVDFADWTTLISGGGEGKIMPALKAWSAGDLATEVGQMAAACSSIGQAFCSVGYLLWASG